MNAEVLTGGNLGDTIQSTFVTPVVTSGVHLGAVGGLTTTIFLGPGDGADPEQDTVAVPMPAGTLHDLWISTDSGPGAGECYVFAVCVGATSSLNPLALDGCMLPASLSFPPSPSAPPYFYCSTCDNSGAATCNDATDTAPVLDGNMFSVEAVSSSGAGVADVSWSIKFDQTVPSIAPVIVFGVQSSR